jgi:hypothetical protein
MASAEITYAIMNDWIKKGENELEDVNKFICYWIAFNCYYVAVTNEFELKSIRKIIQDSDTIEIYNRVYKQRIKDFDKILSLKYIKNEQPNSTEKIEIKIVDFETVMWCIYQVRCNLFHGNKGLDSKRDKEVLSITTPILYYLVKEFFEKLPEM